MNLWLAAGAWFALGFGVGCVAQALPLVRLDHTVRLMEIVNLCVLIAITIFIKDAVQQRFAVGRAERELLIGHIKEMMGGLERARVLFGPALRGTNLSAKDNADLLYELRRVHNAFDLFRKLEKRLKLKCIEGKLDAALKKYLSYKSVVTGDRANPRELVELTNRHDLAYRALVEELTVAVFSLNRS